MSQCRCGPRSLSLLVETLGAEWGGFTQKLRCVCPELTIKADHPPEGHEEKRTPHFS